MTGGVTGSHRTNPRRDVARTVSIHSDGFGGSGRVELRDNLRNLRARIGLGCERAAQDVADRLGQVVSHVLEVSPTANPRWRLAGQHVPHQGGKRIDVRLHRRLVALRHLRRHAALEARASRGWFARDLRDRDIGEKRFAVPGEEHGLTGQTCMHHPSEMHLLQRFADRNDQRDRLPKRQCAEMAQVTRQ